MPPEVDGLPDPGEISERMNAALDPPAGGAKPKPDKEQKKPGDSNGTGAEAEGSSEERARRMGWRPKDEYRGPEENWIAADQFIEKVEGEVPVLRERNRFLGDQLKQQDRRMEEQSRKIDEMAAVLKEFNDYNKTVETRAYSRAREDLERQMDQAAEVADTDAYKSAKDKLKRMEEDTSAKDKPIKPAEPVRPSVTEQSYIDNNPAMWRHDKAREMFIEEYGMNRRLGMSEAVALEQAKTKTAKEHGKDYGAETDSGRQDDGPGSRRGDPPAVGSPTGGTGNRSSKRKKTFDNLPPEAQSTCERFERLIKGFKRSDYLKDYDWGPEYGD